MLYRFRYFFLSLLALVILCTYNGLFLLPVLLSICGPAAELQLDDPKAECIHPPTPEPSPPASPVTRKKKVRPSQLGRRITTQKSELNTISEEPSNGSSYYETPAVRVETTIHPARVHTKVSYRVYIIVSNYQTIVNYR